MVKSDSTFIPLLMAGTVGVLMILLTVAWLLRTEPRAPLTTKYCFQPPFYQHFVQCNHIDAVEFFQERDI